MGATIAQDPHECAAAVPRMASSSVEPRRARARVATAAVSTLAMTTASMLRRGGGGAPVAIAILTTPALSASRTTRYAVATVMGTMWIARRHLRAIAIAD